MSQKKIQSLADFRTVPNKIRKSRRRFEKPSHRLFRIEFSHSQNKFYTRICAAYPIKFISFSSRYCRHIRLVFVSFVAQTVAMELQQYENDEFTSRGWFYDFFSVSFGFDSFGSHSSFFSYTYVFGAPVWYLIRFQQDFCSTSFLCLCWCYCGLYSLFYQQVSLGNSTIRFGLELTHLVFCFRTF